MKRNSGLWVLPALYCGPLPGGRLCPIHVWPMRWKTPDVSHLIVESSRVAVRLRLPYHQPYCISATSVIDSQLGRQHRSAESYRIVTHARLRSWATRPTMPAVNAA